MHVFVPDTNFFLQCPPANTLDWAQVTREPEVVLLVVREVRKELDRLKSGGNHRRAKRARAASALIRRLTSEGLQELELRSAEPRVALRTAPRPDPTALPPNYSIGAPDERIVAEAYAARETAGAKVTFLSHDSVPLEDAAGLGLQTQVIPETWLLDPEPSDLERELGEVKRRMKTLEGRVPDVVVELPNRADGAIRLFSPYFLPLSDAFLEAAMRAIREEHPLVEPPDIPLRSKQSSIAELIHAEEHKREKYADSYAQWLRDIEAAMRDAPTFFSDDPRGMRLPISIKNKGHAGAENLIIRIEAHGDFHLVDVDALEEDDAPGYFPDPPEPPRSIFGGMNPFGGMDLDPIRPLIPHHLALPKAFAHDRHTVYWEYNDNRRATRLEGQCTDFRHGLKPDESNLWLERNVIDEEPVHGALSILVSAGNLPEPKLTTYKVLIAARAEDTEALIREILKRELDVEI